MDKHLGFEKPKDAWAALFDNLLLMIPVKLLAMLDGKGEKKSRHPLTIIVPIVIVTLSVASISNLVSRAYTHHPGLAADMTGTAIAVLVPLAVFAAVHSKLGNWKKLLIGFISLVFAIVSASIQFKIYAPATGFAPSFDLFEALAFGAGVPIAECLLAIIEFLLLEQDEEVNRAKSKEIEHAQLAKEAAEQAGIKAEQERQEAERQLRIKEVETERQHRLKEQQEKALFDFEMEAKRLELAAKLEADRLMLQAKLDAKIQKKSDSESSKKSDSKSDESPKQEVDFESKIIGYYRVNPLASQRKAANDLVLSQTKVNRVLTDLESRKVIHRNGNGVEILG